MNLQKSSEALPEKGAGGKYGMFRACRVLDISRNRFYRIPSKSDSEIIAALQEKRKIILAKALGKPTIGCGEKYTVGTTSECIAFV